MCSSGTDVTYQIHVSAMRSTKLASKLQMDMKILKYLKTVLSYITSL